MADRWRDHRDPERGDGEGRGLEPSGRGGHRRGGQASGRDEDRTWMGSRGGAYGRGHGDFLSRAGERISSWFRGADPLHGGRREDYGEPRWYREDYGGDARSGEHRGGPHGYARADETICEEVHVRLTDDPWVDASHIAVTVRRGEVTLSGAVDSRDARLRAERLVEEVSGVGHVQNDLRVNPDLVRTGQGRPTGEW